ncbi:hypothetical protein M0811_07623 [Anaeramoeba ignava]|uniref:RING-type domain-containing protein n=1 Tax=Anaeramoeba ignava TaxID=1746090 RepID=A0A9Q0LNZ9_ANAIG|nr:hypothetical protein M0811_07623 [Anaeramoeba ignava]
MSFECPICFERYSSQRKPYTICQEGHCVCELCLQQLVECPFCRVSLDYYPQTFNRTLLQEMEEQERKKLEKKKKKMQQIQQEKIEQQKVVNWEENQKEIQEKKGIA